MTKISKRAAASSRSQSIEGKGRLSSIQSDHPSQSHHSIFGHNFGIVYRFEVVRALKKKSFWLSLLAFPILLALAGAVIYFSQKASVDTASQLAKEKFSFAITDESGTVNPVIAEQFGAQIRPANQKNQLIDQVRRGKLDAYFNYPADLAKGKIQIYAQDAGLFDSSKYDAVAKLLLTTSAQATTQPNTAVALSGKIASTSTYYKNGAEYNQIGDMIMPGLFLILFYIIICVFGNQMLTATVEEKENRISEMILTTIKARTLIVGKIFAFMTLILIQALVLLGLILVGYLAARQFLDLPNFDFSIITFNPARITIGAALFLVSTLMFSGIMVAIGAAAPTAKEANQFMAVPLLLIFLPLYAVGIIISTPDAAVVQAMIYFPLTAPVLLMLMNALGTLPISTAVVCLTIMTMTTIVIFIVASRLFQRGAIAYNQRGGKGLPRKAAPKVKR